MTEYQALERAHVGESLQSVYLQETELPGYRRPSAGDGHRQRHGAFATYPSALRGGLERDRDLQGRDAARRGSLTRRFSWK